MNWHTTDLSARNAKRVSKKKARKYASAAAPKNRKAASDEWTQDRIDNILENLKKIKEENEQASDWDIDDDIDLSTTRNPKNVSKSKDPKGRKRKTGKWNNKFAKGKLGKTINLNKPLDILGQGVDYKAEPEPKAKTEPALDKGLWECATIEDVDMHFADWFLTFNAKVLKALKKPELGDVRSTVERLLTQAGATSVPILAEPICFQGYRSIRDALIAAHGANPLIEFALVTFISGDGGTSHFKTDVELFASRKKVQSALRAMSPHHFGMVELSLFNSQGHPDGGQVLQRHEHAIIWGPPGTVNKARRATHRHLAKFSANTTGARQIDVTPIAGNPVNLARMAAYLFKPPYKCKNWNPGKPGKKGHMNGSEKGDRNVRYLRLAQLRTMLSLEDVCFASGDGIGIRSALFKFVRALVNPEAANGRQVLHPDAIASFWVSLVPHIRGGNRWDLPIIRRRP